MSSYKLTDILRGKKEGDEWYCLEAPEKVRFWLNKEQWKNDLFRKSGVSPVAVSVRSNDKPKKTTQKFSLKSPMYLECGVEIIKGKTETTITKNALFSFRCDSCVEINEVMKELTNSTGFQTWEVVKLQIINTNAGAETIFKIHNPDGNGSGLFSHRYIKGKRSVLYPEVLLSTQLEYVGEFYNNLAHCTAIEVKDVAHGCALKTGIVKSQIIKRSKPKK